jgi:hypothetical protein
VDNYDLGSLTHLQMALMAFPRKDLASPELDLGRMHCSKCGGIRRTAVTIVHASEALAKIMPKGNTDNVASEPVYASGLINSVFIYRCKECDTKSTAFVYEGRPGEPHLALFSGLDGGLTTPLTPKAVSYYLDQAQRCRSMNANSAAVAMYRAALEQLLHDKGYQTGMLNEKVKMLQGEIDAGSPPTWARDLDVEYLKVMKDLGNGAIHTNGGDVHKQASLDGALLTSVEAFFNALLYMAYEAPAKKDGLKGDMQRAAALLKK